MLEVQFSGEDSITLEQFNTTHRDILAVNSTLSGNLSLWILGHLV